MDHFSGLSKAIEAFLRQMAADGRTPSSIHSYRGQLLFFARALGDIPLERITVDLMNIYLTSPPVQLKADGSP